jgi:uncharacterized membrane protein YbaN (DUF454 family)
MPRTPNSVSTHLAKSVRITYILLGGLFFGLGMLGVILPVLPTTPFHHWLYTHKTFGSALQRWHQYRIIPRHAKVLIVLSMLGSLIFLGGFSELSWQKTALVAVVMMIVASYLLTRPSSLPTEDGAE